MASVLWVCLWLLCIQPSCEAAFAGSPKDYNSCIVKFLSLNVSSRMSNEIFDANYSILSNDLFCDTQAGLSLVIGHCITVNETTGLIEMGACSYAYTQKSMYVQLPEDRADFNKFCCGGFNRTGTLCGRCKPNHYPLVHSFNMSCVPCSNRNNWWRFVLVTLVPQTVLYFFILIFRINIVSSYLQGFVLFCQVLAMPSIARSMLLHSNNSMGYRIVGIVLGFWNLEVVRYINMDICLRLTTVQSFFLDIAMWMYPFLLMALIHLLIKLNDRMARPFRFCEKRLKFSKTSIVDAFTTFFLLTIFKFLSVSFDLLSPVLVYQINSTGFLTYSNRLYYDATIPYMGKKHIPFAIFGISLVILLAILPVLFMILYTFRCFQKLLNFFPFRWYVLHTFMDIFQGCYKDGTEPGTHDYRWFAVTLIVMRFLLAGIGLVTVLMGYLLAASFVIVLAVLFLVQFQPYKEKYKFLNNFNVTICLFLALVHVCALGQSSRKLFEVIGFLGICAPLTQVILYLMYSHRNLLLELLGRAKARLAGYTKL